MDPEIIKYIVLLITGAAIPIITSLISNYTQRKRDILKYKNDRVSELEKREFEEKKEYRLFLIKSIEEIIGLLGIFDHSISITSSVIHSRKKLKIEEYDEVYQKEVEQLIKLKSIILARFPDFYDTVLKIDGCHNRYWGEQRLLLLNDIKTELNEFQIKMDRILEVANETTEEINNLIAKLRKYSESINNKNAT